MKPFIFQPEIEFVNAFILSILVYRGKNEEYIELVRKGKVKVKGGIVDESGRRLIENMAQYFPKKEREHELLGYEETLDEEDIKKVMLLKKIQI